MKISVRSRIAPLALTLAAGWLVAGCDVSVGLESSALKYVEREKKDFQVSGTPDLVLSTFDGSVEVRAWDRPDVSIEIEKRGADKSEVDKIQVKAAQSGNRITLEVLREERSAFHFTSQLSARLIASVPRQANVDAHTGDGSVVMERVSGRIRLDTGDGSVTANGLAGELRAHTGDGTITLDGVDGRVDADTGDGSITLNGRLEAVRLKTGDGSVRVRAGGGSRMADDWEIHTGDGSVTLEVPDAFDAALDAHTGDGGVSIGGMTVKGDISKNTIRGQLGAGGRNLRVTSGDGGITISKS